MRTRSVIKQCDGVQRSFYIYDSQLQLETVQKMLRNRKLNDAMSGRKCCLDAPFQDFEIEGPRQEQQADGCRDDDGIIRTRRMQESMLMRSNGQDAKEGRSLQEANEVGGDGYGEVKWRKENKRGWAGKQARMGRKDELGTEQFAKARPRFDAAKHRKSNR